jgi:hypothetical protein
MKDSGSKDAYRTIANRVRPRSPSQREGRSVIRNRTIFLLFFPLLFVICQLAWSDHLPHSKTALGKPEHVLAGVNVYDDKIESVLEQLGKRSKVDSNTNSDYPQGSGERSYDWDSNEVRVRVGTEFRTDETTKKVIESAPMVVDVWRSGVGLDGKTGRGLALGDGISWVRQVYGPRFQKDPHSITLQWKDETTLVLHLDDKGRIIHMQLLAAIE